MYVLIPNFGNLLSTALSLVFDFLIHQVDLHSYSTTVPKPSSIKIYHPSYVRPEPPNSSDLCIIELDWDLLSQSVVPD